MISSLARGSPPTAGPTTVSEDRAATGSPAATVPTGLAAPRHFAPVMAAAGQPASWWQASARAGLALLARPAGQALADLAALAAAAAVCVAWTPLLAAYAAVVLAVLASGGQYRSRITLRAADQAGRIAAAAAVAALGLVAWLPAAGLVRLALTTAGLLLAGRVVAYATLRAARRRRLLAEPALVIGAGTAGQQIVTALREHPELGLAPAGFLDNCPAPPGSPVGVLGRPAELAEVVSRQGIRRVIVAFPEEADGDLVAVLRAARQLPAEVCVVPRLHEVGTGLPRARMDEIWGIPLIPLRRPGRAGQLAKRAFDVVTALTLLVVAAPLLLVLGVAVRLRLRRPALFRQVRVTGQGRQAEIVKLRTVTVHGDPDTCWVVPPQRATALGRFLRATHLDELPQLVNVIRGEMSLVGPRPERPYFAQRFEREIPGYAGRHRMTAGLTGWAQVHGLNGDTSISDRARFDNAYVENWSFWLDLVILVRTVAGSLAALVVNRDDGLSRAARTPAAPFSPDLVPSGSPRHIPPQGGQL